MAGGVLKLTTVVTVGSVDHIHYGGRDKLKSDYKWRFSNYTQFNHIYANEKHLR